LAKFSCRNERNYHFASLPFSPTHQEINQLKNELLKDAIRIIPDPNILINMVSRRAKQLKQGHKPLIESLEKLEPEDIAMREIIEGKIDYQLFEGDGEPSFS
jgi:DNA-directed RNA polymerase subunit omega